MIRRRKNVRGEDGGGGIEEGIVVEKGGEGGIRGEDGEKNEEGRLARGEGEKEAGLSETSVYTEVSTQTCRQYRY
jgi:hypothetical protein